MYLGNIESAGLRLVMSSFITITFHAAIFGSGFANVDNELSLMSLLSSKKIELKSSLLVDDEWAGLGLNSHPNLKGPTLQL